MFLDLLNTIETDWSSIIAEINQTQDEQNDLLHEIELAPFNSYEGYILSTKMREVRQRRRGLKDLREIILPLKEFLDRNQKMKIDLFKVLTNMQRIEEKQSMRTYYPRVRTDIKLARMREKMNEHEEDINTYE